MRKHISFVAILLSLFAYFNTLGQSRDAVSKIDSIRIKMQKNAEENQFHKIADLYTDNAVVNGFDGSYSGIVEIRNYWSNIRGKGVDWKWTNLEYSGGESYVTQTGKSLLTLQYGERQITFPSQFSVVWEKQQDGNYKIISDFYRPVEQAKAAYEVQADSVWIVSQTDSLFGVLFRPIKTEGAKSPAMLCLQGGGDVGLSNYFLEARFFAENGIVALVCDKAGAGQSKGTGSWVTQTFQDKTKEYYHMINWLKAMPAADNKKVGVHGMSEGGRLALNLAIEYPDDIAFVNAVSAPVESFKENQLFAIHNLLYERNFDFSVINEAVMLWDEYFEGVANRQIKSSTIEKANDLRTKQPVLYLPPNSVELPQRPQPDDIHFSLDQIDQIRCPVLFQFGEADTRVNTLKSMSLIDEKQNFEKKHYEQTDHAMNRSDGVLNDNYMNDKYMWLKSNRICL